jgi:hypothetical protein
MATATLAKVWACSLAAQALVPVATTSEAIVNAGGSTAERRRPTRAAQPASTATTELAPRGASM